MSLILSLETSTKSCSVAVSENTEILALVEEQSDQYIHSEKLHLFIEKALYKAGKNLKDIDAIAVGKGPGSYTGLRIGISAAKGFCFALSIPLISADGLQILTNDFLAHTEIDPKDIVIPMLDARRMEVYCAIYDSSGKRLNAVEAKIIDEHSFEDLKASKIHLIGDGAAKCKAALSNKRFAFHTLQYPSAAALALLANQKFRQGQFEDIAYFEPFYLKDFIAGKPKSPLANSQK